MSNTLSVGKWLIPAVVAAVFSWNCLTTNAQKVVYLKGPVEPSLREGDIVPFETVLKLKEAHTLLRLRNSWDYGNKEGYWCERTVTIGGIQDYVVKSGLQPGKCKSKETSDAGDTSGSFVNEIIASVNEEKNALSLCRHDDPCQITGDIVSVDDRDVRIGVRV